MALYFLISLHFEIVCIVEICGENMPYVFELLIRNEIQVAYDMKMVLIRIVDGFECIRIQSKINW